MLIFSIIIASLFLGCLFYLFKQAYEVRLDYEYERDALSLFATTDRIEEALDELRIAQEEVRYWRTKWYEYHEQLVKENIEHICGVCNRNPFGRGD